MLSTLLFGLGFSALEGDMINLWLELQPDQIDGNEQHHSRCTCPIRSSIPKEEE
jgi:hypothetical protein